MSYTLLIVESPAKCKKIESYLGSSYKCIASYGHIQELPGIKNIDIDDNFKPNFQPMESKSNQISKMRTMIKSAKEVLLASDDDREGEAIGWHICQVFKLPLTTKRIIFHEITKDAITRAVQNPTRLNINTIYAPMWAQTFPGNMSPNLNYSKFQNQLFNKDNYLINFNDIIFKCFINTCNYFLPVRPYLNVMHKYTYDRNIIDCLDSAVLFTDWLCENNNVFIVKDLIHKHRIHPNSNYMVSNSKKYTNSVEHNLKLKITNSINK
jgi:hypothetical protein